MVNKMTLYVVGVNHCGELQKKKKRCNLYIYRDISKSKTYCGFFFQCILNVFIGSLQTMYTFIPFKVTSHQLLTDEQCSLLLPLHVQ